MNFTLKYSVENAPWRTVLVSNCILSEKRSHWSLLSLQSCSRHLAVKWAKNARNELPEHYISVNYLLSIKKIPNLLWDGTSSHFFLINGKSNSQTFSDLKTKKDYSTCTKHNKISQKVPILYIIYFIKVLMRPILFLVLLSISCFVHGKT